MRDDPSASCRWTRPRRSSLVIVLDISPLVIPSLCSKANWVVPDCSYRLLRVIHSTSEKPSSSSFRSRRADSRIAMRRSQKHSWSSSAAGGTNPSYWLGSISTVGENSGAMVVLWFPWKPVPSSGQPVPSSGQDAADRLPLRPELLACLHINTRLFRGIDSLVNQCGVKRAFPEWLTPRRRPLHLRV